MNAPEPAFQDRERELEILLSDREPVRLLNLYGEAGIGKTRLLKETAQQLRGRATQTLVFFVDLATLPEQSALRPEALLRELIDQAAGQLRGFWHTPEQVATEVVLQLSALASEWTTYLICDTTEAVQDDRPFWDWLEEHLAGPLAVEGCARQIYAGRVRAPWRRIEARRALRVYRLEPLPGEGEPKPVQALTMEVFKQAKKPECQLTPEQVAGLTEQLACGHPQLAQEIARYLATETQVSSIGPEIRRNVAAEVVKLFIEQVFFKDISDEWKEILPWASILDWFDATILRVYLSRIEQEIPEGWEAFFIKGMAVLGRQHAIVEWDDSAGAYRLAGTARDIIRRQMQIAERERYYRALEAAAETFEQVAKDYFSASDVADERERLDNEVKKYRQRMQEEVP